MPNLTPKPPLFLTRATRAICDVIAERKRQNLKWGEQNHPDGTGAAEPVLLDLTVQLRLLGDEPRNIMVIPAAELALAAQHAEQYAASAGRSTWAHVLLEEVFEALAESDPVALRFELVQVAAVAAQWAEAIDRRP